MIVSDLDYLENIESASITWGSGTGFQFNILINQESLGFAAAFADKGDATAIAIAENESNITFDGLPSFS